MMTLVGFNEPCHTHWSTPISYTPQKDGTLRLCENYCKRNSITVKDAYQIPQIDE